ncbi:ABC transporter [Rugosimonospora africana]|uniref:ABC transporter n=1 Tax=Rugosimonospora africana TaxID=556532 RepID=UPI00194307C4|nr:ABC transporter [Rugosimonospora africana]
MTRRTVSPPAAPSSSTGVPALSAALNELLAVLAAARYPLVATAAEPASEASRTMVAQLRDYLLPRLGGLGAPLLVVVGGSTGAGKSTLVNSLVRAPVSQAGVLRPTTRAPVLVHHPADGRWFHERRLLPGFARTTGLNGGPGSLRLVAATGLTPGLALLDAPDIDSVVAANRELAEQLFAAADLWLFVTTAARYADAVPWSVLATARDRGTALAMVLDRVPADAQEELGEDLAAMLPERGLAAARLFLVPEAQLDGQGLLAEWLVQPMRAWFAGLAADPAIRAGLVRQTVGGAVAALVPAVAGLIDAAEEQITTATALRDSVHIAHADALATLDAAIGDGSVLRGEALDRWQEYVGTGQPGPGPGARLRDRFGATIAGRAGPAGRLRSSLSASLATVISAAVTRAEERVRAAWRGQPELGTQVPAADDPDTEAQHLVRLWQRWLLDQVRRDPWDEGLPTRSGYPATTAGLLVTIAVLAPPTSDAPGSPEADRADPATGGGAGAGLALLHSIRADETLRELAGRAGADLQRRLRELFDARSARFTGALAGVEVAVDQPERLRIAGHAVATASPVAVGRPVVPRQAAATSLPATEPST